MLAFSSESATAQNAGIAPLDSGWEFHQGALGSIWEIWRGNQASDNVAWTPVTLPHCFNARDAVDPDVHYYQGPGWYRTRIRPQNPFKDGRTILHFNGAGQRSKVYVGLEKVAEHLGGYDEWDVDITEAADRWRTNKLGDGSVLLAVLCDNSRDAETIPSDLSDFTRYGGIYRHARLEYRPEISMERVHITPTLLANGQASVAVQCRFYNPDKIAENILLDVRVRDPKGEEVFHGTNSIVPGNDFQEIASFNIAVPGLWSPKHPALYTCEVTLNSAHGAQSYTGHFGVRSMEWVEHGPFLLNGERLLLRGTQYHEDFAGVGAAVPDEVVRRTFQQIKDMGANFVRLGHYQQSPLVLDLCDQLGILVWEEIPWCRGGIGGKQYQQEGRDLLRDMIDQHYNHPAVILWGLGNENGWPGDFETYDKAGVRRFMTELNDLAHHLDPSRQTTIRFCEFCKDIPDVYSPSIWAGWYSGRYTDYRGIVEKAIAATPHFFHAEWGGDSQAGRFSEEPEAFMSDLSGNNGEETAGAYKKSGGSARASKDGDWSESYIANLFDWHLKEQEQMTNLTGTAQWIFRDFATPLRPENPVPFVNQKGLTQRDGSFKEGYYIFQSYWADRPMVHILGHGWAMRWGRPDEEKLVEVFSNCREVELFVNGVSAGMRERDITNFPAAGLHWMVKLNPAGNSLRAVAHYDGGTVEDQLQLGYQTAGWGKPARLTLEEISRSYNVATLEARIFDSNNVPCLNAANTVRFGMTGEGQLLDDLGTVGGARVVQLCNGRAWIRARLDGQEAMASVTSAGLPPAFVPVMPQKKLTVDVESIDRDRILTTADAALHLSPISITQFPAKMSKGGPNDFYSEADYFWPDPRKTNGLPYINRDGESNPGLFAAHRMAMRQLRDAVSALAAAYKITGDNHYVGKAAQLLQYFFLNPATRMSPNLQFAQAVRGGSPGRSWGIIDGLHMAEIPLAIEAMQSSPAFPPQSLAGLKNWFQQMTDWMMTSANGMAEASAKNNHSIAFFVQIAAFSQFTGDEARLAECRRQYKEVFVPNQMAVDGSFPLELKRTKPYGYSIFQLNNMAILCQLLSKDDDSLWDFSLDDGRGMRRAMDFLYPYLADKTTWPHAPDVQAWDDWPIREPALLFSGLAYQEHKYLELWKRLPATSANPEVLRNEAITQPLLWLRN